MVFIGYDISEAAFYKRHYEMYLAPKRHYETLTELKYCADMLQGRSNPLLP